MGPGASPRLGTEVRRVEIINEVDLTHYDGIHDEVLSRQS